MEFISLPACQADVVPASLFTSHAVLQHGVPVPIWGKADPGENVKFPFWIKSTPSRRLMTATGWPHLTNEARPSRNVDDQRSEHVEIGRCRYR